MAGPISEKGTAKAQAARRLVQRIRPLVLISTLATGGAEKVTVAFCRRLAALGAGPGLCTVTARHDGPLAGDLVQHGIRRFDLRARRLTDPYALGRLVRLLKSESIGLVHAHGQDASILAAAACLMTRTRLVITRHVLEEPEQNWRQVSRAQLTLKSLGRADAVVAVSRSAAEKLSGLSLIPVEKIHVITNGIQLDDFAAKDPAVTRQAVCSGLNLDSDRPIFLIPSVLRKEKGHRVLIEGMERIQESAPGVQILFAGDGPFRAELEHLAQPYRDSIRFLGDRDDMPRLLHASDLVILPSLAEALPTVLMEAAAAGKPVVATAVGGALEIVSDGETGLLVPPADSVELAQAIARLWLNREMANSFGQAALKKARKSFSVDLQVRRTLQLWDDLV